MKNLIYAFIIAILLISCKNNDKHMNRAKKPAKEMQMNKDNQNHTNMKGMSMDDDKVASDITQKNKATTAIIDAYLQLKNALVVDDKVKASESAKAVLFAFNSFDRSKLESAQKKTYTEIYEDAKEQAEHIVKSHIDHQREHFENLSIDVNDLITLLGTEKTLYKDFCPMAGEGQGAIWLSEFKEIKTHTKVLKILLVVIYSVK